MPPHTRRQATSTSAQTKPEVATFYGRKSTKDNGKSVAQQHADYLADCKREGTVNGPEFADPDRSASRYATRGRPGYVDLLAHLESGECRLLVLWEASRGSRRLSEWTHLLDLCRDHGILIRILDHHRTYDVRIWRDYRTLAEEGLDAQGESERTSARVKRGRRAGVEDGKPGGPAHYGYEHHYDLRGNWMETVAEPDRAEVVKEIARRVLGREPLLRIARDLTDRGIPAPRGSRWYPSTVADIASNPAYVGQVLYLGEIVGETPWPPLIGELEHFQIVGLLGDPDRRTQRGTELKHLLSGVVTCGECEAYLRPGRKGTEGGQPVYRCYVRGCMKISVTRALVEEVVEALVLARLRLPDADRFFAPPDSGVELAAAHREEREVRQRLDALYAEGAAGRLSPKALAAMISRLEPMLEQAEQRVRRVTVRPAPLAHLVGVDVPAHWSSYPMRLRRDIVAATCALIIDRSGGPTRYFDRSRLSRCRWTGDQITWGETWKTMG